jgi:hypothetical protein
MEYNKRKLSVLLAAGDVIDEIYADMAFEGKKVSRSKAREYFLKHRQRVLELSPQGEKNAGSAFNAMWDFMMGPE